VNKRMKKNHSLFMQSMQRAISIEATKTALYTAMHGVLDAGSEAAPILRRIITDEERHLKDLSNLCRSRAQRYHTPEIRRIPFHSVRHGFRLAIQEEFAAQDLYNEMYAIAPAEARDFLRRAHGEEVNHILWLLYLLHSYSAASEDREDEPYQKAFLYQMEASEPMAADRRRDPDTVPMPVFKPMAAMPPNMPR
jgi:rubrerythrin